MSVTKLPEAVENILVAQKKSRRPLAIILAGHNGSGKSTMWYKHNLADKFRIPLINADRMMLSILPEKIINDSLPDWAVNIRDNDLSWMQVAQQGVQAFVARAMSHNVPFAMETVFSHWKRIGKGQFESKIDLIKQMQNAGYYVLLFFVGLSNTELSILRVSTRVAAGGHDVGIRKLQERFPRTQIAVRHAIPIADAAILTDNSREMKNAFTVCRVQMSKEEVYDIRNSRNKPAEILEWLNVVSPR